eukprot:TRINITY_DN33316_c0_g1_i1.p1 TRINITY_DN33316_c0_g1~~TRINITY_DN33316_c0_g1_i1.p1  ORF type:complete len:102 (+),score=23.93 TRINITY_DN33316_c0_g1_i1:18-323(+)
MAQLLGEARELAETGLCVMNSLIGDEGETAQALWQASLALFAAGGMRPGALGGGLEGLAVDKQWRGDYIAWLGEAGPVQAPCRSRVDAAVAAATWCAGRSE